MDNARFCPSCGTPAGPAAAAVAAASPVTNTYGGTSVIMDPGSSPTTAILKPPVAPAAPAPPAILHSHVSAASAASAASALPSPPVSNNYPISSTLSSNSPVDDQDSKHKVHLWSNAHDQIVSGLADMYAKKVKPIETAYRFDQFHSPLLTDTDFHAKPLVLLLGQYSVGKTSFIKFLLERDFPGQRIGPEPTTDRFVSVMYNNEERIIPGNAAAVDSSLPWRALQRYGMAFLNKFEVSSCPAPILSKLTFVDTPGVLSGEKQRIGRSYDFPEVIEWFAERADRILLLFDAHKLDISDEFKRVIETLKGHDDKIRVVLNKADMVTNQQLMRVYGALMWSLGKVIKTPEVLRVYIGSFWDRERQHKDNEALFDAEQNDLLSDLRSLPRHSAVRKVNELVKRSRCAKVHAYIVSYMREQFGFFGKEKTQKKLLDTLPEVFKTVQMTHNLPPGDFPNPVRFKEAIGRYKIWEFPKLDVAAMNAMEQVLSVDIPQLMKLVPASSELDALGFSQGSIMNPFADENLSVANAWEVNEADKRRFDTMFYEQPLDGEKMTGNVAKGIFMRSGLPVEALKQIWTLADIARRGALDCEEFAVAMYLCECLKSGKLAALPDKLPLSLVPPSKRHMLQ